MMKHRIYITIVTITTSLILSMAALNTYNNTYVETTMQENKTLKNKTTKQLSDELKEAIEERLPQTAQPIAQELLERYNQAEDTVGMLKVLNSVHNLFSYNRNNQQLETEGLPPVVKAVYYATTNQRNKYIDIVKKHVDILANTNGKIVTEAETQLSLLDVTAQLYIFNNRHGWYEEKEDTDYTDSLLSLQSNYAVKPVQKLLSILLKAKHGNMIYNESETAWVDEIIDLQTKETSSHEVDLIANTAKAIILLCKARDNKAIECNKHIEEAISILKPILNDNNSVLKQYAENVINFLQSKHIEIKTRQHFNPEMRLLPIKLQYRNVTDADIYLLSIKKGGKLKSFKDGVVEGKWTVSLPILKNNAHTNTAYHELDIETPNKYGEFAIVACIAGTDSILSADYIRFTQISTLSVNTNTKQISYVSNYTSGAPLTGAKVNGSLLPDNGIFEGTVKYISYKTESLIYNSSFHSNNPEKIKKTYTINVITDRTVFRPGEKLYYKIVATRSSDITNLEVMPDIDITATLQASNGNVLYSGKVTTNNMGSANGVIDIPSDAFTGQAQLIFKTKKPANITGYKSITIDEYKPKNISIKFLPIDKAIFPTDTFHVYGKATGEADLPVANGTINYNFSTTSTGTVNTSHDGSFDIQLTAPDKYCLEWLNVKLTDAKGETAEDNLPVSITKRGTEFSANTEQYFSATDSVMPLHLSFMNANNGAASSTINIEICEAKAKPILPSTFISELNADTLLCTPTYNINNKNIEVDQSTTIASEKVTCNGKLVHNLQQNKNRLKPGFYLIKATATHANGETETIENQVTILRTDDGEQEGLPMFYSKIDKSYANANDKVVIRLGTALPQATFLIASAYNQTFAEQRVVTINKGITSVEINTPKANTITESDEYKIAVFSNYNCNSDCYWGYNDGYNRTHIVKLLVPQEPLPVKLTTFRNLTSPNAKEEWIISLVNGALTDTTIECVASMYDDRLDNFSNNSWIDSFKPNRARKYTYIHSSYAEPKRTLDINYNLQHNYFHYNNINQYCSFNTLADAMQFKSPYEEPMVMYSVERSVGSARMLKSMALNKTTDEVYLMADEADVEAVEEEIIPMAAKAECVVYDNGTGVTEEQESNIRSNFNSTVFFFPSLSLSPTDSTCAFKFQMPGTITNYKFQMLAHNKLMQTKYITETITARKALNIQLGLPRFLVMNDTITIPVVLQRTDTSDIEPSIECKLTADEINVPYTIKSDKPNIYDITICVPQNVQQFNMFVKATAADFTDAVQATIPIVNNCITTEYSHPFVVMDKQFSLKASDVLTDNTQATNTQFEYTSNAYIAVLNSLPYLDEEWNDCADTYMGRIETNAIANYLKNRDDVKSAINKLEDDGISQSKNLGANTPFLYMQKLMANRSNGIKAMLEGEKSQKNIDINLRKLAKLQEPDGGIKWINGSKEASPYISAECALIMGQLMQYGMLDNTEADKITRKLAAYLNKYIKKEYDYYKEQAKKNNEKLDDGKIALWLNHYLYALSTIDNNMGSTAVMLIKELSNYKVKDLPRQNLVEMALLLRKCGYTKRSETITKSIVENLHQINKYCLSVDVPTTFWGFASSNTIVANADLVLLLQTFPKYSTECSKIINWLMMEKRSSFWANRYATSRAVLAIMGSNANLQQTETITIGGSSSSILDINKSSLNQITETIQDITITRSNNKLPSWGAWRWQQSTTRKNVTNKDCNELQIKRTIHVKDSKGDWHILEGNKLNVGDVIQVEITLTTPNTLSFVQIADNKSCIFEQVQQTSEYRWSWPWFRHNNATPAHYFQPKDQQILFFIEELPIGTHTFNYQATVTNEAQTDYGYAEATCLFNDAIRAITK